MTAAAPVLDVLTERQERVLELSARGYAVKEIAYRLGISEHTARHHRERAIARLGAVNLTHAVVLYLQRGQIGRDL